jgi:nicotinic acid mononucleotide adenylyltransferase
MRQTPWKGLPLLLLALAAPAWAQTQGAKSAAVERVELSPAGGVRSGLGSAPTLTPGLSAATLTGTLTPSLSPQAVSQPRVSVSAAEPTTPVLPAPAGLPPAAVPPAAPPAAAAEGSAGETVLQTVQGKPNRLGQRFDEAKRLWAAPQGKASDVSVDAYSPAVARVSLNIEAQLAAMSAMTGHENDPLFATIARKAQGFLRTIDGHIKSGAIDPTVSIRTSAADGAKPIVDRQLRVGVYPVAGDPLHWGHILVALQAIAELKLDKVIFVMAGDDPRKPNMTKAAVRHPLGRAVLETLSPFLDDSPIAVGTDYDGETNIFRILALNPDQMLDAYYMVGDDHYKLKNASGGDDTIPKLEKNRLKPELGYDAKVHDMSVVFIERETKAATRTPIPSSIEVRFLPELEFEASSTEVRKRGRYALMPYSAYDYIKRHKLGLYGIPAE